MLTKIELSILQLKAEGLTDKEVGQRLSYQRITISMFIRKIIDKLGAKNAANAVYIACKRGII